MPALDTNVLVRFLVQDDPRQTRVAARYIAQHADAESSLFIPTSVALETDWVLRSVYRYRKDDVIEVFVSLLESKELEFQDEVCLERAVYLYREHNVDFADCLHVAAAHTYDSLPLVSFDKQASRVVGIEYLV